MTLDLARDTALTAVADHAFCELGDEAVVLNLETGVYYGLDRVGTSVWRLLQQPRSLAQVRDFIVGEFDVGPGRCEADLLDFVGSLTAHGLLLSCDVVGQ
jgi:hypothetical protein